MFRSFLRSHVFALAVALLVGLISVAPQLVFIGSLGDAYQGIHFFHTPNEEAYMAMMQEIRDGHPNIASMPFFEYKDASPLIPPTMQRLYVGFANFFHLSLPTTLIISKFFLPALLFFLVYFFIFLLTGKPESGWGKVNAIAAGFLVTLGFDLVDYRSIISYLFHGNTSDGFLVWTRPVNPISGALFLFSFLIGLWQFFEKKRWWILAPTSVCLALMMASYFFSWSLALVILGLSASGALLIRDYRYVIFSFASVGVALFLSSPYWYMMWKASTLPGYEEASHRIGLLASRTPHMNKVLVGTLIFFLGITIIEHLKTKRRIRDVPAWGWFCFIFIISGFVVYNQQVITGKEIWYYHYVFYTIPLSFVVILTLGWYWIRSRFKFLWHGAVVCAIIASLALGIFVQSSTYASSVDFYRSFQEYRPIFDHINKNTEPDCVILVKEDGVFNQWSNWIPAFTHCNTYISGERFVIAPLERFVHNYLTLLRLRGVSGDDIDAYLASHRAEAHGLLYYQLQSTLGYPDPKFDALFEELPSTYREFMKKDFRKAVERYRVDYVLSVGPLDVEVQKELSPLKGVFEDGQILLFSWK